MFINSHVDFSFSLVTLEYKNEQVSRIGQCVRLEKRTPVTFPNLSSPFCTS